MAQEDSEALSFTRAQTQHWSVSHHVLLCYTEIKGLCAPQITEFRTSREVLWIGMRGARTLMILVPIQIPINNSSLLMITLTILLELLRNKYMGRTLKISKLVTIRDYFYLIWPISSSFFVCNLTGCFSKI